jgi:spore coat polysaccharide biosynthesis protein SpsF (cytidylyltransferase family)
VSYEIAEYLIESHFRNNSDFTCAKEFAVGTACEIIEVNSLRKIIEVFGAAPHSEYMSWYFNNNPEHFSVNRVKLPKQLTRDYRLTLDYPEDLDCFNSLCEVLGNSSSSYSIHEIFEGLDKNSWIGHKNSHIELSYKVNDELINLLNSETKINMKSE